MIACYEVIEREEVATMTFHHKYQYVLLILFISESLNERVPTLSRNFLFF